MKDLVSCSINIYNRASYPISSVLYKYSRGRIDSRCSSLCEKLVLPFALVPFFFLCFVFFLLLGEIHAHRGEHFQELLAADN